jgi:hypothetical protein
VDRIVHWHEVPSEVQKEWKAEKLSHPEEREWVRLQPCEHVGVKPDSGLPKGHT